MPKKADYTKAVGDRIIDMVADGKSMREIVQHKGIPSRPTIYKWLDEVEAFADQYARAREMRADKYADEIIDIADEEPDAQRARNRIDARKWAAGKLKPKTYGDRTIVQGTGEKDDAIHVNNSSGLDEILGRLARLAERSGED